MTEPDDAGSAELERLAERHLDHRSAPPGHATYREPELPASEWRAAYFVLARIALEQLDECRNAVALAGHRTPDPHDCFLMNCRDLGPEVESLRDRLRASLASAVAAEYAALGDPLARAPRRTM